MEDDAPRPRRIASRVRGTANALTLIGVIASIIGWATHWPPTVLGRVMLLTLTAFIISFIAILAENRGHTRDEDAP